MKRLYLAVIMSLTANIAQAEMRPFEHDDLLAKMYLQVDMSECPRIVMQEVAMQYIAWVNEMNGQVVTKEDSIYMQRLANIFGEVFISYHYGN